jgi:hypothetical protein
MGVILVFRSGIIITHDMLPGTRLFAMIQS